MSKAAIRREANRNQVGSVFLYDKTQQMAVKALNDFLQTGEKLPSDILRRRKRGSGSIRKRGKRYEAMYTKNKKAFSKYFDTPEECEEWIKQELKF